MADLAATSALDRLTLPVASGRCRLAALPEVPRAIVTAPAEGVRFGIGQWLVEGDGEVDVSDAFAGLALDGPAAADVLARLVPLDLTVGLPARTLLRHTPVIVTARTEGFGLLVPRSYAASAVEDLVRAMRAVAAREDVCDAGVKKRPRVPPRMQARAMPTATWVPVPVPPISARLRCWARKPPLARSRTGVSLIGVPSKTNSSISFAIGSLAMAIWYLIERLLLGELGGQQVAHHALRFVLPLHRGGDDLVVGRPHAEELELAHRGHDPASLHHPLALLRLS